MVDMNDVVKGEFRKSEMKDAVFAFDLAGAPVGHSHQRVMVAKQDQVLDFPSNPSATHQLLVEYDDRRRRVASRASGLKSAARSVIP
jgi:hypothetical protein